MLQIATSSSRFVYQIVYPRQWLTGMILTIAAVNVVLGNWDGEQSQVVSGLVAIALLLGVRSGLFQKRGIKLYENAPNSGKNET